MGSAVVAAEDRPGGFSPGVAARLRLADGRRLFVKAVSASVNPESPKMHRAEARIAGALPPSVPSPRFLWSYDDGDWVALAFEDIDGSPPILPWRTKELERVLDAVTELSRSLTPSPVAAPPVGEVLGPLFTGWRREQQAAKGGGTPPGLDPWAVANLDRLVALEAVWEEAGQGHTLLHADLRADNLLLTGDRVYVVDWPHGCVGAGWIDLVCLLPSVAMQGGPPPWEMFEQHPVARGAEPQAVDSLVAALAGFFTWGSRQPAPPGLPTLRPFQAAQGRESLAWLRHRIDRRQGFKEKRNWP